MTAPISRPQTHSDSLVLEPDTSVSIPASGAAKESLPVQTDTIPLASREYWRTWLTARCLFDAALLNLVPWGETQLAKLPTHVHEIAVRLIADLQERCCKGELARGGRRTERLHDDAQREIWRTLRPFAQRGEHYVEHLVGSADEQREFLARIGEGIYIEPSKDGTNMRSEHGKRQTKR